MYIYKYHSIYISYYRHDVYIQVYLTAFGFWGCLTVPLARPEKTCKTSDPTGGKPLLIEPTLGPYGIQQLPNR